MRYSSDYHVDVALCIDKTADMRIFADSIRRFILSFQSYLIEEGALLEKDITVFRMKIIAFGDYWTDKENTIIESPFFVVPEQNDDLLKYFDSISFSGGGDIAENGFEALATAIKTDWTTEGDPHRRHIIFMFSNAPALPLGERADCPNYPKDLPKSMDELSAWWHGSDESFAGTYDWRRGRLIAFVPNHPSWNNVLEIYDRMIPMYLDEKLSNDDISLGEIIQIVLAGWC